jgi:hypothetical protein
MKRQPVQPAGMPTFIGIDYHKEVGNWGHPLGHASTGIGLSRGEFLEIHFSLAGCAPSER